MLTFEFTGADGKMTLPETLTSGMVGKEISIITDSSWNGLQKFAVFRAGNVCKSAALTSQIIQIPKEVLLKPFCKLFVGVYGTDKAENLVIPTIMAEGPYIRYGADPMEDSTAEELPVWKNLQDQIGDLEELDTLQKDSLVAAVNELFAKINEQPEEEEEEDPGLSSAAAALLVTILRQAIYYTDQSANITALEVLLNAPADGGTTGPDAGGDAGGNEGEDPDDSGSSTDPTPATYTVTNVLTHVTTSNSAAIISQESGYSATLTAEDGFELQTVTVIMGGVDISASACSGNRISIGSVTGNLIITASAVEISTENTEYLYHWDFTSGTLIDRVKNTEAIIDENVIVDSEGAHFSNADSFIKMPVPSADLVGSTVEVKFGAMTATTGGSAKRLYMVANSTTSTMNTGLFYSTKNCWTNATSTITEFTDIGMFSGRVLTVKHISATQFECFFGNQLICTPGLGTAINVIGLGGWTSSYLGDQSYAPMVVESVKVYKTK